MKLSVVIAVCCALYAKSEVRAEYLGKNQFLLSEIFTLSDNLEKKHIKPQSSKATIVKQEFIKFKDGGYRFYFETDEGQSREEVGFFRNDPQLGTILNVHGSYGYIGPTNKKVFVKYTSDERGFRYENSNFPPVGLPSNIINQQLGILNL